MRWTEEKDKIVAECLVNNRTKEKAFEAAARTFGTKPTAVATRYYRRRAYIEDAKRDIIENKAMSNRKPWFLRLWNAISSMLDIQKHL